MFTTVVKGFAVTAIFVGLLMIAGSAGDCDGACMDQANTLGEMMTVIAMGIAAMGAGIITLANVR